MVQRKRRIAVALFIVLSVLAGYAYEGWQQHIHPKATTLGASTMTATNSDLARDVLNSLEVKGRAPKTGYKRAQFGDGWADAGKCDMRNFILNRDLTNPVDRSVDDCTVLSGTLNDPYTGKVIKFERGKDTSDDVQIDHVVALSDAWQKGAQQLSPEDRAHLANDALELLAVDGAANQQKSDADAATWLPPNKNFRCRYVARQVAVKQKYKLWVTQAEKDAISRVLSTCPDQRLPVVTN